MPTDSDAPSPSVPHDQMLSVEDVAKILNVSRPYVAALADAGELGVVARVDDGKRRIPATAVQAYCTKQFSKSRDALGELAKISQEAGLYNFDTRGR